MKIALWSWSAYKLRLLKHVLTRLDLDPEIVSFAVSSGVADQPCQSWETKQWSVNRASAALALSHDADLGCGIEFGYEPVDKNLHCVAFACIIDRDGYTRIEHSSSFKLPESFRKGLHQGQEVGDLCLAFDDTKPNHNLARSVSDFLRKDDMLVQAYHSVWTSYLSDKELF